MILERHIQKLSQGVSGEQYIDWERKWDVLEKRCGGGPAKRHSVVMAGGEDVGTIVWEREWESLATMEAHYDKLYADPESRSLIDMQITCSERAELYNMVPRKEIFGEE